MRKYSKSKPSPSLARGQEWKPRVSATHFRKVADDGNLRVPPWNDPTEKAQSARIKNASPRGRRK